MLENGSEDFANTSNSDTKTRFAFKVMRGVLLLCMIGGYLGYRLAYSNSNTACITDAYHDLTYNANRGLLIGNATDSAYEGDDTQLTVAGKGFIGTGQVLVDLWIAIIGIIWIAKVHTFRVLGAFAAFFLVRSVVFLNVQKFPFPELIVWRNPSFFSFTVPYDHTNDFFYSGHTGTLAIIFFELVLLRLKVGAVFAFLSLVFMMNMLLITRVHYTIDVMAGLIFAIFFHKRATQLVYYIDWGLSLPFFIGKKIYQRCCKEPEQDGQAAPTDVNALPNAGAEELRTVTTEGKNNVNKPSKGIETHQQKPISSQQLNAEKNNM